MISRFKALSLASVLLCATAQAQNNALVSVSSAGAAANHDSYYSLISANGRYVVFQTQASNPPVTRMKPTEVCRAMRVRFPHP